MNTSLTQKEIAPGIILLKSIQTQPEILYSFQLQLNRLNKMEFTADFTGSENILVNGQNQMKVTITINAFETKQVAILTMNPNWKLKTKFKFILKTTDKTIQEQFIKDDVEKLQQEIEQAKYLKYYPIQSKEISEILKNINQQFIDPEFLPIDQSIYGSSSNILDTLIQWRRPLDYFHLKDPNKRPEIFFDKIEPNDIKLGALGNGWFISSLSSIAERQTMIKRLFITTQINQQGIYRVKLCKNGEWIYVTIDDYFPCYPLGSPIFSATHGNELWVLILEKAYAKLHGNYFAIKNGYSGEALMDLTGCPTDIYKYEELKQMWEKLKEFNIKGYIINAFIEEDENINSDYVGLIPGFAYTILQVKEIKNNKLINIRNPWGNFEWKGDWSDTSSLWTNEISKEVGFDNDTSDGQFWMCWKDFLTYFKGINVCKSINWEEVRIKGKFIKVTDIEDENIDIVLSKWYYVIQVQQQTQIIFGLHQEDQKIDYVELLRPYLDIGLTILKQTEKEFEIINQTITKVERQIQIECDLNPGVYYIIPRTSGLYLNGNNKKQINLIDINGNINPIFDSIIQDIFRKFDLLLLRELSYIEFKGIYDCLDKQLEPEIFQKFLKKYASTKNGLTLQGFLDFFIDQIQVLGLETIYRWLEKLGYDKYLNSIKSRCFLFTVHSTNEISVIVKDSIITDFNNKVHVYASLFKNQYQIIEQLKLERQGIRVIQCYNRYSNVYTIIAINDQTYPINFQINLNQSIGLLYSTKTPIVKKQLESGQMETIIHFKPNEIDNIKIINQIKWQPIK